MIGSDNKEQTGYVGATNDPGKAGTTQDSENPYILIRIRIFGRETLASFKAHMAQFLNT